MALDPQILTDGLGAFDELEELGSGTFGTTFRVVRGDDEYAIKVIHMAVGDQSSRQSLRRAKGQELSRHSMGCLTRSPTT